MHELGLEREESFCPLVELPNGCPAADTFERVLQHIEPHCSLRLSQCLWKRLD